jgi:hypothetical protein
MLEMPSEALGAGPAGTTFGLACSAMGVFEFTVVVAAVFEWVHPMVDCLVVRFILR